MGNKLDSIWLGLIKGRIRFGQGGVPRVDQVEPARVEPANVANGDGSVGTERDRRDQRVIAVNGPTGIPAIPARISAWLIRVV